MPTWKPHLIKTYFYELGREEPLSKIGWWIFLRWILVGIALFTALAGNKLIHLQLPTASILLFCLPVILLNVLLQFYLLCLKRAPSLDIKMVDRTTYIQFGTDWIFIALLFHYTGGVASPLLFYFLFHIILSGVLLERWACFTYITLIAITITVLAILELVGYLPHISRASFIASEIQNNPFFVLMLLIFFYLVLYISSSFVSTLLKRLRERIGQLTELQQQLERTNQKLELLNSVARFTTSTLGLGPRLNFICSSIRELMGVKGAVIRLLDERTNRLELVSGCGLSEAYMNKGPVDADKSLARALKGEPHLVLDVATDPSVQYPQEALKEGIISMLSYPLRGREKVIGTLRLYSSERINFSQEEMDFLAALASQGAISIENAKIYDVLKRQDEAKSEFITLMAHELKGPLMAIQGFLEIMLKGYVGTLTDKQNELIGRMHRRIESVLSLSSELLTIYQWQSRGPSASLAPVPLKTQIQKAADLFNPLAQEKGLNIMVDLPDENLTLIGTDEDIETILNNLITNAIKYTPPGGTISVTLLATEDQMTLIVKDTGIGIPSEDIPKIFNEFYRTKKAKIIDPEGSGLGLPFVKKIVESLGGTIRAQSEEDKGTEFIMTFVQP